MAEKKLPMSQVPGTWVITGKSRDNNITPARTWGNHMRTCETVCIGLRVNLNNILRNEGLVCLIIELVRTKVAVVSIEVRDKFLNEECMHRLHRQLQLKWT